MKRVISVRKSLSAIHYVELVIATFTATLGAYIVSPLYRADNSTGTLAKVMTSHVTIYILGLVLLVGGLSLALGIWRGLARYRNVGLLMAFFAMLFLTLTQILGATQFNMNWAWRLSMVAIAGVCYVFERVGAGGSRGGDGE